MRHSRSSSALFAVLALVIPPAVLASGGGENMLLVVNPDDEPSLRVANAYQQLRGIPDRNILFISPPAEWGQIKQTLTQSELLNSYVAPITQHIQNNGLDHVDYIGTLGQPLRYQVWREYGSSYGYESQSLEYGLMQATQFQGGLAPSMGYKATNHMFQGPWGYQVNTNNALHHSQVYPQQIWYPDYSGYVSVNAQYYMAGAIAFTGFRGNSPNQVIANLASTSAADGAKPQGTIYLSDTAAIQDTTRSWQFDQAYRDALAARGIPFVTGNGSPNTLSVRGAFTGGGNLNLPNGSVYLPGSWADNVTSFGATFDLRDQIKATAFTALGAGATSGTITEPYADWARFPAAGIFLQIADGSTLGEAFHKSVNTPDVQMFIGDLLAQPYADKPVLSLSSAPANNSTVSGSVQIQASASVPADSALATRISKLQLYLDGRPQSEIAASSGTFDLDTTALSDGRHELRFVATNNAAAASENSVALNVLVNNHGQSVVAPGGDTTIAANQLTQIQVAVTAGSQALSYVQLRHLGRSLGDTASPNGQITVDATRLAYGPNTLIPVAVFADGSEVQGLPITLTRATPPLKAGTTPTDPSLRTPGLKAEYFLNRAGDSIANTSFSGTPDLVTPHLSLSVDTPMDTSSIYNLAARFTGKFAIDAADTGEYQFFFYRSNDSVGLYIDGEYIVGFDNMADWTTMYSPSVFLGEGEHTLELLAANRYPLGFNLDLSYRDPHGMLRQVDSSMVYQVPEPGVAAGFCLVLLLGRRFRGALATA